MMKMMKGLLAAVVLAGTIASASAATIFSSRTTFGAAGSGTSTFNDLSSGPASSTFTPITVGTLSFTGNGLYVTPADTTVGVNGAPNASAWVQVRLDTGGSTLTISNSAAFQLIGFDLRPYQTDLGETISFTASNGETGTFVTPATNDIGFIGFRFSAPVTSVTFAATNGGGNAFSWFGTDNYQLYSTAATAAVPEPATWGMMILGFGLMGVGMRRAIRRSNMKFDQKIKRITEGSIV